MLILTRRVGETLMIGDSVTVTILGVEGNQVRVGKTGNVVMLGSGALFRLRRFRGVGLIGRAQRGNREKCEIKEARQAHCFESTIRLKFAPS